MTKKIIIFSISFLIISACIQAQDKKVELCVGYYQTEKEAVEQLKRFASTYSTRAEWEKRAAAIREGIIKGAELDKIQEKYRNKIFNPIIHSRKFFDGYTVENIAIETIKGYYVTGNLYKPAQLKGKNPAILCPHGHWRDPEDYGRFREDMQRRCASLARMGAVVFAYDMNGFGESTQGSHDHPRALQIQTWNSIRIVDYLLTLDYVDPEKIAVTGASGGGTQSFILTAVDDRIAVSVPVVQISAHFFGGCVCESGMPIHKSKNHETNNVEIAALAAPRPMLIISDGDDWTKNTPEVEFPYIRNVYKFYNVENIVQNVHFENEKHNYGISKRKAAYGFLAKHLRLNMNNILNNSGDINENFVTVVPYDDLKVFDEKHVRPERAVTGDEKIGLIFQGSLR
ncbi:alpha/beta hydrolase family protein [candidate division KSB1 bacterium]